MKMHDFGTLRLSSRSRRSRRIDVMGRCSEPPSTRAGGQDDVSSKANSLEIVDVPLLLRTFGGLPRTA